MSSPPSPCQLRSKRAPHHAIPHTKKQLTFPITTTTTADAFRITTARPKKHFNDKRENNNDRSNAVTRVTLQRSRECPSGAAEVSRAAETASVDATEFRQCVVVGGGIAGLAAARDLESAGLDFVLLEASDRLGGRIYTYDKGHADPGSRPLELGAQWLHGTEGNSLYDFCVEEGIFDSDEGKRNLALAKTPHRSAAFQARRGDGTQVDTKEFRKVSKAWSKAVLDAEKLGAQSIAEDAQQLAAATTTITTSTAYNKLQTLEITATRELDGSSEEVVAREDRVGHFLSKKVGEILAERERAQRGSLKHASDKTPPKGPDAGVMGYLERTQCTIEGCDDLYGVSIAGYGVYEELYGGDVRVPGGFSRIVDALVQKTPQERLRLNCPVVTVQWGNQGEERDNAYTDNDEYSCAVEYKATGPDGAVCVKRIACKQVLVTVGLGVLKDGSAIAFSPSLPPAKLSAIDRLGFGTADKVFIRCSRETASNRASIPEDKARETAEPLRSGPDASFHVGVLRPMTESAVGALEEDIDGRKPEQWLNDVYSFVAEGQHVYSWLTGPSARAVEQAPALQVQEGLLSSLRTVTHDASWRAEGESRGCVGKVPGEPVVSDNDQARRPVSVSLALADNAQPENGIQAQTGCFGCSRNDGMKTTPASVFRNIRGGRSRSRSRSSGGGSGSDGSGGGGRTGDDVSPVPGVDYMPLPPSLVRSTWNSNPLFRGSYSYIATGSSPADIEELAQPLRSPRKEGGVIENVGGGEGGDGEPRVFFAGEATHSKFFSTAHGGYESGIRAAEEMLKGSSQE